MTAVRGIRRPFGCTALALAALVVPPPGGLVRSDVKPAQAKGQDRAEIAYAADGQIRLMRVDGTAVRAITNGRSPSWSPDGRVIAFESESHDVPLNGSDIYLVNADGRDRRRVVTHVHDNDDTGTDRQPTWAPDNYRIAFTSDRTGDDEIWVTNSIGHATGRLTASPSDDHSPAWSPDGESLAFVSDRDGNAEIYVLGLDGKRLNRLTHGSAADEAPAWSPDGRRIAFASARQGKSDIYVMDADGGNVRRLTAGIGTDTNPAWSLDGQSIVYTSANGHSSRLHIVAAEGGVPRALTDAAQLADGAAWRPGVDLTLSVRRWPVTTRTRSTVATLAVANTSPIAASDVVVVSQASPGARLTGARAPGGRCAGTRRLTCRFAVVSPGSVVMVRGTWRASRCGAFALRASVSSFQSDLDADDNAARMVFRLRC